MLQDYLKVSVSTCSLLPFIDEFVPQRLISQISIMLFLKNISIKAYWYISNKMLLLYLCVCFFKLTFHWKCYNVSATSLKTLAGKKNLQRRLHFQINPFKAPTPCLTIIFIILWDSFIFYQILLSPQVKQCTIITYRHYIYELLH